MTTQQEIEEYKKLLQEVIDTSGMEYCVGCGMTVKAFEQSIQSIADKAVEEYKKKELDEINKNSIYLD